MKISFCKIAVILLSMILVLSSVNISAFAAVNIEENILLGDVDLDNTLSIRDATLVQKYVAKIATLDEAQLIRAAVYENRDITVKNSTYIQKIVAQLNPEGYQIVEGKKYYYINGVLQKNGIVGSDIDGWMYADENGVCCISPEIVYAAEFVKTNAESDTVDEQLRECFDALVAYDYARYYGLPQTGNDISNMAISMFDNKAGNCYCYAAAFACIAKVLGYDTQVVTGQIQSVTGSLTPHGWTEVLVGNEHLICDPDMEKYKINSSYYMQTFEEYPVKPLVAEKTYSLQIRDGVAVWE